MITKSYLKHEIVHGAELSGVKRIHLHDLRHSYVKLRLKILSVKAEIPNYQWRR